MSPPISGLGPSAINPMGVPSSNTQQKILDTISRLKDNLQLLQFPTEATQHGNLIPADTLQMAIGKLEHEFGTLAQLASQYPSFAPLQTAVHDFSSPFSRLMDALKSAPPSEQDSVLVNCDLFETVNAAFDYAGNLTTPITELYQAAIQLPPS